MLAHETAYMLPLAALLIAAYESRERGRGAVTGISPERLKGLALIAGVAAAAHRLPQPGAGRHCSSVPIIQPKAHSTTPALHCATSGISSTRPFCPQSRSSRMPGRSRMPLGFDRGRRVARVPADPRRHPAGAANWGTRARSASPGSCCGWSRGWGSFPAIIITAARHSTSLYGDWRSLSATGFFCSGARSAVSLSPGSEAVVFVPVILVLGVITSFSNARWWSHTGSVRERDRQRPALHGGPS